MCQVPFTHQEPIVVAWQLDRRIVEPPRHATEVLRTRLPVRRPAHEAALQQHTSTGPILSLFTRQTCRKTRWAVYSGACTWSIQTSVSMWQLWCARLLSLMAGGWQPGASHSSVCT